MAAYGATFTVTNTNSSGAGSLAQAMRDARYVSDSKIVFELTGAPPYTIEVVDPLPPMDRDVWIHGDSQPGYFDKPLITIVNRTASPTIDFRGGGSGVVGLRFVLEKADGVVSRAEYDHVNGCVFERAGEPSWTEGVAVRLLGDWALVIGNTIRYGSSCIRIESGLQNTTILNTLENCYA